MLNSVYLEIDNFCNSKCIYCYNNCRNNEFITIKKFEQLIKRLKKWGINTIILSGGEPTIHPQFIELLKILQKNGFNFGMSTNGLCITEDILKIFKENKGFMQISLDTTNKEDYKKIRGVDKLDMALNNIKKSISANIDLNVGIVLTNLTIKTLEKTIRDLSKMGIQTIHAEEIKDVGFAKSAYDELYIKDYFSVLKRLYYLQKELYPTTTIGMIEDILLRICDKSCSHSCCNCMEGNMIQIGLNGAMYHCKNQGSDSYIGNIFDDNYTELLNNAKQYKLHYEITRCKDCKYGYICRGGCRAKVYANKKNLYEVGTRCEEMQKIISLITKEKEEGKINELLIGVELSFTYNKMNGFQKMV